VAIFLVVVKLVTLLLGAWLDPDARRKREKLKGARSLLRDFDRYAEAVLSEDGEAVDAVLEDLDRKYRSRAGSR